MSSIKFELERLFFCQDWLGRVVVVARNRIRIRSSERILEGVGEVRYFKDDEIRIKDAWTEEFWIILTSDGNVVLLFIR